METLDKKMDQYRIVLAILADMDYNDGANMRWFPSGMPTEQAVKVAKRIVKELAKVN